MVRFVPGARGATVTRPASEILVDLAAVADRQAALNRELAVALRAPAAAPERPKDAPGEYLTTAEAAELLGVSARHLRRLRAEGVGPGYVYVGDVVRYPRACLISEHTGERTPLLRRARRNAVQRPSSSAPSDPSSAACRQEIR